MNVYLYITYPAMNEYYGSYLFFTYNEKEVRPHLSFQFQNENLKVLLTSKEIDNLRDRQEGFY